MFCTIKIFHHQPVRWKRAWETWSFRPKLQRRGFDKSDGGMARAWSAVLYRPINFHKGRKGHFQYLTIDTRSSDKTSWLKALDVHNYIKHQHTWWLIMLCWLWQRRIVNMEWWNEGQILWSYWYCRQMKIMTKRQWFYKVGKQRFYFCKTFQGVPSKMLLKGTSPVSWSDKQHSLWGIEQAREIRVKM